ncbi:hypothetical protein [Romboutsia sp.]|uniref:hypothetical protein n=1 Tax=Romboutsia sp. TaxID=1965302 RepID=UPI003F36E54F
MIENKPNRTVEKIKKLIDVGLTKTKISKRLGVSDTTISYAYKYGKQISSVYEEELDYMIQDIIDILET